MKPLTQLIKKIPATELLAADYIVVGGGLTGCVIASRLAQAASFPSVMLLEAGPAASDQSGTDSVLAVMGLLGGDLDH
jgi:choline dehydrogenase-like flavoprotein